jgi:hypothetical protein
MRCGKPGRRNWSYTISIVDPRKGVNTMVNPQRVVLAIEVNMRKEIKLPLVHRAILTVQTTTPMRIGVDYGMRKLNSFFVRG